MTFRKIISKSFRFFLYILREKPWQLGQIASESCPRMTLLNILMGELFLRLINIILSWPGHVWLCLSVCRKGIVRANISFTLYILGSFCCINYRITEPCTMYKKSFSTCLSSQSTNCYGVLEVDSLKMKIV